MRRFLLSVAACALGLGLPGTAEAHGRRHYTERYHSREHRVRFSSERHYYREHAIRFGGGYYYRGRDHHHWTRRVWDSRYERYHYYDPGLDCYYYWHPVRCCYYPVSYHCD